MKSTSLLLLTVLLFWAPCGGLADMLTLDAQGVTINAGAIGEYSIPAPIYISDDGQEHKPTSTLRDGELSVIYDDGFAISIRMSGNSEIKYEMIRMPERAASLKFITYIPINLNNAGKYSLGAMQGEFPGKHAGQFLAHGEADRLEIIHALGDGIRITTPSAYQQLQDNRTWNWNIFAWIYRYDFKRYPGQDSFVFRVEVIKPAQGSLHRDFLVDRYGQSTLKEWPGKITDDSQLQADVAAQAEALGSYEGPELDAFGGLAGSRELYGLNASGFFYVTTVENDRHVLVTPEGNLFFQLGVCGVVNTDDFTAVKGREKIYEWLPSSDNEKWKSAWRGNSPSWGVFSFQIVNWIRKYGKPYSFDEWSVQAIKRLRAWGFNSLGAFGPYTVAMREEGFPTVAFLPDGKKQGAIMLPEKIGAAEIADPFAPGFEAAIDEAYQKHIAPRANDPLVIGYFLGNEQHLENIPKHVVRYQASQSPAKARLMQLLQEEYVDIESFNAAWLPAKSFESFAEAAEFPLIIRSDAAAADMRAFLQLYLDAYYGSIRKIFKKHDPNHLLIGSRWTPHTANNRDVVSIAGKYLDVISVNYYTYQIEEGFFEKIYEWGQRPLLLSEWYFSATDHGLGAAKEVNDQAERGMAYRNYVEQAAATGVVVGSQWFIYTDQAITGRFFEGFNGEGNNTGLVDVTDRPYEPLVTAAALTHARIYEVLLGHEEAYAFDDPRFSGKGREATKYVAIPRSLEELTFELTTTGWPGRPAEPIGSSSIVLGTMEPGLSGAFRLCWDEGFLHLIIQVSDPTPALNHKPAAYAWAADCIELFIGSRNPDQEGSPLYSDRHILISASENPEIYIVDHPESSEGCRAILAKDVSGDGYMLRVELPWSALGITPNAGMEMLFDLAIDNSGDGETRTHQLVWNGTDKNSGDRGVWGRARLSNN
ncbi:sugar-binding protein [Cerasicoccus arenae]|uniref:Carbohydrate-binding domain-containing protein n=1 Tax=Cerasicoccus arenae TaxID=424488 RepID=A0A8J3DL65_9BACT|nr:sugar-binding protein [Cerasicoccus arenae]MBK1859861.1 hypothetical protein [Cerasicoccus arenae]GHC13421.1 hypothetical protein GCM10007047_33480 [Cerasicoccus arenae]